MYGSAILETNLFPTTEFWSASQEQDTLKMDSMLIVRMKLLPAASFTRELQVDGSDFGGSRKEGERRGGILERNHFVFF